MAGSVLLRLSKSEAMFLYDLLYAPQDGAWGDEIREAVKLQRRIRRAEHKTKKGKKK